VTGPVFRDVRDGDVMPRHVFNECGELSPVALLSWICPSLTQAQAERMAREPDAAITATSVIALRALIQRHHR
jgi:hypothetical protein